VRKHTDWYQRENPKSSHGYPLSVGRRIDTLSEVHARLSGPQQGISMITSTSRRHFIGITPFVGIAFLAACSPKSEPAVPVTSSTPPAPMPAPTPAPAASPDATTAVLPRVDETDAQAVALGYVVDATKADTVKFKNYVTGSQCGNCALYQGKVGSEAGPCPLFAGKSVVAKGWCTSWVKKA